MEDNKVYKINPFFPITYIFVIGCIIFIGLNVLSLNIINESGLFTALTFLFSGILTVVMIPVSEKLADKFFRV